MRWSINGMPILGPDAVEYRSGETTTLLNGAPRKHTHRSIVLSYRNLHASMLADLWQAIYDAARNHRTVLLSYYDQDGVWRTSPARPRIPTIGSLRGVEGIDVVLTFFLDPNIDIDFVGLPPAPAPSIGEQPPPDPRRFLINQIPMVGALLNVQAGTPAVSSVMALRDVIGVALDALAGTPTLVSIFPPSFVGGALELLAGTPVVRDNTDDLLLDGATIAVEAGTMIIGDVAVRFDGALFEALAGTIDVGDLAVFFDGALLETSGGTLIVEDQPEAVDLLGGDAALETGTLYVEAYIDIEWSDIVVDLLAGTPDVSDE